MRRDGRTPIRRRRDRRGFALPLAVLTLGVVGVMIAGTFYLARLEQQAGQNTLSAIQALGAAEAGIDGVLASWNPFTYNTLPVDSTIALPLTPLGSSAYHTDSLLRLSATTFMIWSNGERRDALGSVIARRSLGRLVRLEVPAIDVAAAITTQGDLAIEGWAVDGRDSIPGPWSSLCPPVGGPRPGIRDTSASVSTSGPCIGGSCIFGAPPLQIDSTLSDTIFDRFGSVSFDDLFAAAAIAVQGSLGGMAPVVVGTPARCDLPPARPALNSLNWGDPLNPLAPCGSYFPLIAAAGGTSLTSGVGQGVLLVDGDLKVSGGVAFYGPVIVRGSLRSTGSGGHFYGGLLVRNAASAGSLLSGGSQVTYSSCAVSRALTGAAPAKPLKQRSWAQLF